MPKTPKIPPPQVIEPAVAGNACFFCTKPQPKKRYCPLCTQYICDECDLYPQNDGPHSAADHQRTPDGSL